jgi:BolA protein
MSIQTSIESKLQSAFEPVELRVINESHMHSVPANSETHFKVVVVSGDFDGKMLLARHRAVNGALAEELAAGLHALSIEALTPQQWAERNGTTFESPPCGGGSKGEL